MRNGRKQIYCERLAVPGQPDGLCLSQPRRRDLNGEMGAKGMSRIEQQRRVAGGETALRLTFRRVFSLRRDAMSAGHGAIKRRIRKNAASCNDERGKEAQTEESPKYQWFYYFHLYKVDLSLPDTYDCNHGHWQ